MVDWHSIQKNSLSALTDLRIIQSLCAQFNVRPSRENGQNFLIEPKVAQEMAIAAELKKDDIVLEIGPGFGALTAVLAQKAGQVIAVEKDQNLFKALEKIFEKEKNVQLVNENILKSPLIPLFERGRQKGSLPQAVLSLSQRESQRGIYTKGEAERDFFNRCKIPLNPPFRKGEATYKLVSNLPYSITSMVLRRFTEEEPRPELLTLLVQKEVAERVCAKPGKMSLLSLAVQFYAQPEIVKIIPPDCFWPKPEVFSAILKIQPFSSPKIPLSPPFTKGEEEEFKKRFFKIARIGFSSRRKQLQNNLAAGLRLKNTQAREILTKAGFDPRVRAQDLSVDDWLKLAGFLEFTL